jgi:hypothetical protein
MGHQHEYTQVNINIEHQHAYICQVSFHDDAKCKEFEQAFAKWRGHKALGCSCVISPSLPTSRHDADAGLSQTDMREVL